MVNPKQFKISIARMLKKAVGTTTMIHKVSLIPLKTCPICSKIIKQIAKKIAIGNVMHKIKNC